MKELRSRSKRSSPDSNLLNSSNKKKRNRIDATDSEESSDNDSDNSYDAEKTETETKRSVSNGLDVFEFDGYDNLDYATIKKKNSNNSSSKDKWNLLYSKPNRGSEKKCRVEDEMEDDESDLPISVFKKKYRLPSSDKPIRSKGENGALKVMNKKKKLPSDDEDEKEHERIVVHKKKKLHTDAEDEKQDEPVVVNKKKKLHTDAEDEKEDEPLVVNKKKKLDTDAENEKESERIVVHKEKKLPSDVEDEKETEPKVVHEKKKLHRDSDDGLTSASEDSNNKKKEVVKPILYSRSKRAGKKVMSESKDESSSKQEVVKSEKVVKKVTPVKVKESKVNRGSGTEKQILRDKIKNMLLDAGWTIDYRPRRGRDYMDSVYISPAGTGYWSIVKAYDVFLKEEEENSKSGNDFNPLPGEVLDILTRQTRKKMEREGKKGESEDSEDDYKEEKRSSSVKNGRKSRKLGRSTLLVRGSDKGVNSENDGFVSYPGKRTLLSWLIDSGVVEMSENVEYMSRKKTRVMQKGRITKDGIHCDCCSKTVTISKFAAHAGSKLRQPFLNIILKSGKSLMQCLNAAWNKQGELERKGFYDMDVDGDDPNDDTCQICGDGGDLICCDSCPSTFHQSCLEIQMLPQGDWHCPNCSCRFCKKACEKVGGEKEASLVTCCFCQKKYHESCRSVLDVSPMAHNYSAFSFCGQKCHELYSNLQKLFGVKHELESGFSWYLIHRSDISTDDSNVQHSQHVQWNSILAVAMSVMDECFLPFTDRRSGMNLIRNVVFNCGSNLSRLNYSSFFTAILEKDDEVFCAASIRIHGTQLAEMPFIGTRHLYRRQGMCRLLLFAIESALSSLQVEKLIIPAVAEHMNTWTDVFGFHPLEESLKQELKSMNMVVFPGTDMLQKPVAKQDIQNTVPQVSETVEEDVKKALPEIPELISSEVKTGSGSEESGVPLNDGCSVDANKETLRISLPVKNDDLPAEPKLSSSVDSHIESNVEEFIVQVDDKIVDKPIEIVTVPSTTISSPIKKDDLPVEPKLLADSVDSHLESNVEESIVQVADEIIDKPTEISNVPSTTICSPIKNDDLPVEPKLSVAVDLNLESNVEESIVVVADDIIDKPIKIVTVPSTTINSPIKNDDLPVEPEVPTSVDSHLESNVEESIVQVIDEIIDKPIEIVTVPSITIGSVKNDDLPVEPELSASVDSHLESNVEESIVEVAEDIIDKPVEIVTVPSTTISSAIKRDDLPVEPELPDSVDSHLESNVEESTVKVTDDIIDKPVEIVTVPSITISSVKNDDLPVEPELPVSVDSHLESNVEESTVQVADEIIDKPVEIVTVPSITISSVKNDDLPVEPKLSASVDLNLESNVEESTVQVADEIIVKPVEIVTVPSTTICSPIKNDNLPVEPKLSVSVDSHLESNVEESTVQVPNEIIDKPIDIVTVPSTTISSSVITNEPNVQSSVEKSVSVNSHFDTNVPVTSETSETVVQCIEVPTVLSTTVVSSVIPSEPEIISDTDTSVVTKETIVESIEVSSVIPSEPEVILITDTNMQVTKETIVESVEVPAVLSTTVVSSVSPSEPNVHSNSDTNIDKIAVQNGDRIKEDVHSNSMVVEIIDEQKNGCEITEIPSNKTISSDAPCEHELQSSGIKSVSVESQVCADVILETGKHADNHTIHEKEGSCEKESKNPETS